MPLILQKPLVFGSCQKSPRFLKSRKRQKVLLNLFYHSLYNFYYTTAKSDLEFLNKCKIDKTSARKIVSTYYDVLRSILEAISAIDGFKIYAHEAFTFFLREKNEEIFAEKFDRFRRIRNSINYYGKSIGIEEAKETSEEIKQVIKLLIDKYLREIN